MSRIPIACNLLESEQSQRREELSREVFNGLQRVEELEDGYALAFPGDESWAVKLVDFVTTERKCCPFFVIELVFEPDLGPVWLRLRGSEEIKGFLEGELSSTGSL